MELRSRGFNVVAVEISKRPELAKEFLGEIGVTFPVVEDTENLAARYAIRGTPTTFVLSRDGRIWFRSVGYSPGQEVKLKAEVEYLLDRDPV